MTLDRVSRIVDQVENAQHAFDPRLYALQNIPARHQQNLLKLIAPTPKEIELPYLNNNKKPVKAL